MSIELLETRIEVLLRSIGEVEAVVRVLKANREAVLGMSKSLTKARLTVDELVTVSNREVIVEELTNLREALDPLDDAGAIQALDTTLKLLSTFRETAPELASALKGPAAKLAEIAQRAITFDKELETGVSRTTAALRAAIESLLDALRDDPETLPALWEKYIDDIVPAATYLFSDYMDLLAGVSIRERGVAISALSDISGEPGGSVDRHDADVSRIDELCAIGDWHVKNELALCVDWASAPITIPGREATGQITSWPILRLGFASWSIWGMPLEGHEFGQVVAAQKTQELASWAEELAVFGERGLRVLVADTIGAWTEGPAYACALLLLSLDPRHLVVEHGTPYIANAERALLVEMCLRNQIVAQSDLSPEEADAGYGYLAFVEHVVDRWKKALPAANKVNARRADVLTRLPARVWRTFSLKRSFGLSDWRGAANVWDCIAGGRPLPDDPPVGMRHLMNAAWYARSAEDVSPRPTRAGIERQTLRAGQSIVRRRQGGGPRPGQRRHP